jgi:hypothetical protein
VKCRFSVDIQSLEKSFYALEHLKKRVFVRANILGCLRAVRIMMSRKKVLRRVHTERRTPTLAKIAIEGGNACKISIRMKISDTMISRGIPG